MSVVIRSEVGGREIMLRDAEPVGREIVAHRVDERSDPGDLRSRADVWLRSSH